MKMILKSLSVAASLLAGAATADTNITVNVNGTNVTVHVKTKNMPLTYHQLEKVHGERVGVEKDPISSTLIYVYKDGFRYERKFPRKMLNSLWFSQSLNRRKLRELEEAGKLRATKKGVKK